MTFKDAIHTCLYEKYGTFNGRASQSEYWYFYLFSLIVAAIGHVVIYDWLQRITGLWSSFSMLKTVFFFVLVALLIPALNVGVRRSHDRGFSFWRFVGMIVALSVVLHVLNASDIAITIAGFLLTFFYMAPAGNSDENDYGSMPEPPEIETYFWQSKPYHVIAFAGVVILAGAIDVFNRYSIEDYAKVHPDGSVEYALRDDGEDGRIRTDDDGFWVMRFPKGLNVETAEMSHWRRAHMAPRHPRSFNSFVRLVVWLPNFTNATGLFDVQNKDAFMFEIWSPRKDYEATKPVDPSNRLRSVGDISALTPFRATHDQRTTLECRQDAEIAPGVFSLRSPTAAEIEAVIAEIGERNRLVAENCRSQRSKTRYAIYDLNGDPLALGYCSQDSSLVSPKPCKFRVWLDQERLAVFHFDARYLAKFHDLHAYVRNLVTESTIPEKSRNIKLF